MEGVRKLMQNIHIIDINRFQLTNRVHPSRENTALIQLRRKINNIAETVII